MLQGIPNIVSNDVYDLDKDEFDEPYIDDEEGYQRIVASKKMPKNKIKESYTDMKETFEEFVASKKLSLKDKNYLRKIGVTCPVSKTTERRTYVVITG